MRSRVLMISVASSAGTIAYFGFGNWLPSLLEDKGVTITKSLLYTAATGLTQPLVPLLFLLFVDRIQRKWQIIIGGLLSAVFGLLFTQQTTALGWIACGVAITAANNLMSTAMHTYRGELFPTRIRGRAIGFVYSIDRIAAAFNSYIIGFLLVSFHVPGVFAFITGALVVCTAAAAVFGPRTRGLASEEIGAAIEA
jgi:putative MFS transporter